MMYIPYLRSFWATIMSPEIYVYMVPHDWLQYLQKVGARFLHAYHISRELDMTCWYYTWYHIVISYRIIKQYIHIVSLVCLDWGLIVWNVHLREWMMCNWFQDT